MAPSGVAGSSRRGGGNSGSDGGGNGPLSAKNPDGGAKLQKCLQSRNFGLVGPKISPYGRENFEIFLLKFEEFSNKKSKSSRFSAKIRRFLSQNFGLFLIFAPYGGGGPDRFFLRGGQILFFDGGSHGLWPPFWHAPDRATFEFKFLSAG